jgi:hypothetical protein
VLAVPVRANYDGEVKAASGRWKEGGDFLRQVYPISNAGYDWVLGQELDASDESYDLTTDDGQGALWDALADLQPKSCITNPNSDRCYDLIVGFIPDRIHTDNGTLQGFTYGAPANIVVESDDDMPATVAHEVAHTFDVGDEYDLPSAGYQCDINPPPPGFVGREYTGGRENYSCSASTEVPFPIGSGSLISAKKDQPFEVGGRGQLPDMISFMGSGAKQENNWITPRIYDHIFGQLEPGTVKSQASASKKASRVEGQGRIIYISGFIPRDVYARVRLDSWYSFEDKDGFGSSFVPHTGAYAVVAVDANGSELVKQGFDVSFTLPDSTKELSYAPFETALPFPEGTVKFLLKMDETVLAEVAVSRNVPTLSVNAPLGGEQLDGQYKIMWSAQDADADHLHYNVEYSPDGSEETFMVLATDLEEAQWTADFAHLPGGENALIRITVTDGANTTAATSEAFKVALKGPEVSIDYPVDQDSFIAGAEIVLSGSAYDHQINDWLVDDAELTWSSDKDGVLGSGETIYVDNLSVGKHSIMLTAKNTFGLTAVASVNIDVEAQRSADPR